MGVLRIVVPVAAMCLALLAAADPSLAKEPAGRWSRRKAQRWYDKLPWLVGGNYTPRTAINQLEFWQAETFDPKTIDQEFGWAHAIGFNVMRVYLHHIPYQQDPEAFGKRIDAFLALADKHGIRIMFVLLDDCWDPQPKPGKQPAPKPHLHNSGWVQCPGAAILSDPTRHDEMKPYVQGVIRRFRDDPRVLCWDLYNEPGNQQGAKYPADPKNKPALSILLLRKAFDWAREVGPSQPLTVGLWAGHWSSPAKMSAINRLCAERSDIITFHSYGPPRSFQGRCEASMKFDRPVICTEYLNRPGGCTFQALLPYMKARKVGAIHWGFVAGKIQTQYPWASWRKTFTAEPKVWFHDVLRGDGTPFDPAETKLIRTLTATQ